MKVKNFSRHSEEMQKNSDPIILKEKAMSNEYLTKYTLSYLSKIIIHLSD